MITILLELQNSSVKGSIMYSTHTIVVNVEIADWITNSTACLGKRNCIEEGMLLIVLQYFANEEHIDSI